MKTTLVFLQTKVKCCLLFLLSVCQGLKRWRSQTLDWNKPAHKTIPFTLCQSRTKSTLFFQIPRIFLFILDAVFSCFNFSGFCSIWSKSTSNCLKSRSKLLIQNLTKFKFLEPHEIAFVSNFIVFTNSVLIWSKSTSKLKSWNNLTITRKTLFI